MLRWTMGLALASSALSHAAAQVHVVAPAPGPGVDFTSLQAAVDASSPGDSILVKAGQYAGQLVIDGKSVRIFAEPAGAVVLGDGCVVRATPLGGDVVLRGVSCWAPFTPFTALVPALLIEKNDGAVWIEDSRFHAPPGANTGRVWISDSDAVTFVRCRIYAGPIEGAHAGITALASGLALYDCELRGAQGQVGSALESGAGLRQAGGFLLASGCKLAGGAGSDGTTAYPLCVPGGTGGVGLDITAGSAWLLDCALDGGPGGAGCPPGAAGAPVDSAGGALVQSIPGAARHHAASAFTREGQTFTDTIGGQSGDLAFVDVGAAAGFAFLPALQGVLLLQSPFTIVFAGVIPASGSLTLSVPIQELGAGVEGVALYLQAGLFDAVGAIYQTAPSAVILLDAAL